MSDKPIFASVNCKNIKTIQALANARDHAFRLDENSKQRVDASRTPLNLVASQYGSDGRDVVDCFKQFKAKTGIKEQKGASVAMHMLCIVSPEWLQEAGDPRDPNNPRVKQLFQQSQAWAESAFGAGSVIASRLDVDEAGSGVVDVFVCPSSVITQKNRPDKTVISTRKALKNIQRKYKKPRSFMALQDSFAEHCKKHLDERIQRGIPKSVSQREHVHADIYRPIAQRADKLLREAEEVRKTAEDRGFQGGQHKAVERWNSYNPLGKMIISASVSAFDLKEAGAKENADKANRAIQKWKNQNKHLSQKVANLEQQFQSLKQDFDEVLQQKDKPYRDLQKSHEMTQNILEQIVNHCIDNNFDIRKKFNLIMSDEELDKLNKEIVRDFMKDLQQVFGNDFGRVNTVSKSGFVRQ